MASVDVVKGSADEAILRAQYGDSINYNYTNKNQFVGADRNETNKMYQSYIGSPGKDAGDLWGYKGGYTPSGPSAMDQMEGLKQASMEQVMAQLNKQRNTSLSNLRAERLKIEPQFQKQKIAAGATARQTARTFDNYMAQRGGGVAGSAKSGIGGQGTLLNNIAYQGQKGALDKGEVEAFTDNDRRVTGVNNAYESDLASASAGIQAQYLQNYINQLNQDRTFNYGMSRDAMNDSRYLDELQYGRGRDQITDDRYLDETTYNREQDILDRKYQEEQLALEREKALRGYNIPQNSPAGKTNMDDAMIEIDNQISQGISPGNIAYAIEQQREYLKRQGINVDALIKAVWEKAGLQSKPELEDSWR